MNNINLILGGTSGLGQEIAATLRANGKECFVVGRSYDAKKHGEGCALDLSDRHAVDEFVTSHHEMLGNLESLYWMAGYGYMGDFADQTEVEAMVDVNVTNPLAIVQAAWRGLLDQQKGKLIVVASTTGVKARNNEAVYALTKHAQVGFARSLGLEAERLGKDVDVLLVLPGGMKTPFWDGKEPAAYDTYNDPRKVAERVVEAVQNQADHYQELLIERGDAV